MTGRAQVVPPVATCTPGCCRRSRHAIVLYATAPKPPGPGVPQPRHRAGTHLRSRTAGSRTAVQLLQPVCGAEGVVACEPAAAAAPEQ